MHPPELVRAVQNAEALLVTAGAGMGVDSGLPDFRGREGFWKAYPVAARLGLDFTDLANPARFESQPRLAWAFYGHRFHLYRHTPPHAGFELLRDWANALPQGGFVFTSNVDGQFQRAGFAPDRIVECHGSIHHLQCTFPCTEQVWAADPATIQIDESAFIARDPLPRCPECERIARPNILMFGDVAWIPRRTDQQEDAFAEWLRRIGTRRAPLLIVEIGAGLAVPTVRRTSERLATSMNAVLVRINPRDTAVPRGHFHLACGALEGIRILDRLRRNVPC